MQDPLTLYKLIILYMLQRVDFPLTKAQISDFILEKQYTSFLTLQQVISELIDADMITAHSIRNRTHLSITKEGRQTQPLGRIMLPNDQASFQDLWDAPLVLLPSPIQ